MRGEDQIMLLRQQRHPAQPGDAADKGGVGLQDVQRAGGDQVPEFI